MSTGTTTYRVPGISCGHCEAAITDELARVAGVAAVDVDIDAKLVRVDGTADHAAVIRAIDDAGYEAVTA